MNRTVMRASRPNIVLIVADDLGWGDLASVNGGPSETPNLDALDVLADPGETTDVAAAHPERVRAMQASLDAWFADVDTERRSLVWD